MRARAVAALGWLCRTPRRAFLIIFGLAFALRLGLLVFGLIPEPYLVPGTRLEPEAVAASLVRDGRFADPYAVPTGPTAHVPPLHAAGLAVLLAVFGDTAAAGWVKWVLVFVAYATVYAMLPALAGQLGLSRRAGALAGLTGALVVTWPEEVEAFTALALLLLVAAFHRRWTIHPALAGSSVLLGIAAGIAFHLQPVLLAVVVGFLAYELWRNRHHRPWRRVAAVVLGAALACAPWAWRNYQVFGELFFVRSNLGLELRLGNHEGAPVEMDASAPGDTVRHPRTSVAEALRVREMGERAYMRAAGHEAEEWIRGHPAAFLRLTGLRVAHFWLGPSGDPLAATATTGVTLLALLGAVSALRGLGRAARAALLIPLATYPLIYYVLAYSPRYRVPLDWLLLLLAGTAVWLVLAGAARSDRGTTPSAPRGKA